MIAFRSFFILVEIEVNRDWSEDISFFLQENYKVKIVESIRGSFQQKYKDYYRLAFPEFYQRYIVKKSVCNFNILFRAFYVYCHNLASF